MEETPVTPDALEELREEYRDALLDFDRTRAVRLIHQSLENGVSVRGIYLQVFQPVQYEIGHLWQTGRISVAEEHYCTAATQFIMAQLYPYIFQSEKNGYRAMIACVGEELHEIGARMVADIFELEGWDTDFLGANTPGKSLLGMLDQRDPDLLCLSTTMDFNLPALMECIAEIRESPGGRSIRLLVGGRPFHMAGDLWKKVGADGTADNAVKAVEMAGNLVD